MKPITVDDLHQLFGLSIDMLSVIRADGTFKHVNPSWTMTLGWSQDELVNTPYMDLVHPDDHEATMREAERLAQGARTIDFENRYRAKDGTYRWMNWRVAPSADGQRHYCLTRDVTDDRRMRNELASRATELRMANAALDLARRDIQAILDHSPVIVFVTDTDGRYRMLNNASTSITGRPPRELIGLSAADVFPAETAACLRANLQRVIVEGRALMFEETFPVGSGHRVYSVIRFPLRDANGDVSAVCGMSQDVTDQRAAAEAIQQARAEADRANRAKSDFLSRMSHELRTPLNAMLGFAQLFERDEMTPDERENVRHILEGGRHLLDLINEVIDISRVESGTLALSNEAIDVADAIASAVGIIRPLATQRGIAINATSSAAGNLAVLADRQRLRQVLLNLLSNAVKYNHPDGAITVISEVIDGRVRIAVRDTGPGIRLEQLALLFHPFERLGAEKSTVEGTGLGLALSKALCEAMGGQLRVDSVVDQGTTFTIDLAVTEAAAATHDAIAVGEPDVAATSGTVVYIEDNTANARLMERIIARRKGLRLVHVGDGSTGVETVRRHRPALVLLDLQLPGMSGESVLRELWVNPQTRSIPVVVLTADATRGLPERLIRAGAKACLTKPLDVQQVLRTIDRLITENVAAP